MISVIMPVKNGAKTIEIALQSILKQTFQDFEILIIDDNSDDNSLDVINKIAKNTGKIKIIQNQKSLGIAGSLNLAIKNAQYEFLARMDQDDEALPDRLKLQVQYLQKNPDVSIVGGQVLLMGITPKHDYFQKYECDPEVMKKKILKYSVFSHPTVMYRKSVILKVGGYRNFFRNAEDYDLWLRVVKNGYQIANLNEPVIRYRLSLGGATFANRWVQYVYHRLAQHTYYFPNEELNNALYKKIEMKYLHLRPHFIIAGNSLTLDWLLKTRQFKKAWLLFKLTPNKLSMYSIKKICFAVICGLFRMNKGWHMSEFYAPYSPE